MPASALTLRDAVGSITTVRRLAGSDSPLTGGQERFVQGIMGFTTYMTLAFARFASMRPNHLQPSELHRSLGSLGIVSTILPMALLLTPLPNAPAGEVDFVRDIRPLFAAHCIACHGGVKQAAELSLVYPQQVLPPDGWVVEPGNPAGSELIDRVESSDPERRMPPLAHGEALSAQEIQLLRDWIAQGARWQRHWAFEKPTAQPIPVVGDPSWSRGELDAFVLARLEAHALQPAPEAEPFRWLRRVSLDLIGLPPTPDELALFLADFAKHGEAAYQHVVDRLLASEHFGERWASVWLDQVRYADSMGLGIDSRRTVWKYRDWVIQALNKDLPYDQFTIKQIAGDLLPHGGPDDLIATACHRLTQSNGEGGTDDEEFRTAAVLDRVNTTWQAWQGVTFGCAQCHSHPYEPIAHQEYYEFAAFFNNTVDCDLDSDAPVYLAPVNVADYPRAETLDQQMDELRNSIWQAEFQLLSSDSAWTPLRGLRASSNTATRVEFRAGPSRDEFRTVGTVENQTDITLETKLPAQIKHLTAIRIVGMPLHPEQAVADSEWGFVWSHVQAELIVPGSKQSLPLPLARIIADEPDPLHDPQESLNKESQVGFGAYSRIHYPRMAALVLTAPVEVPAGAQLRVRLRHDIQLLGAFSLVTRRGHLAVSDDPRFTAINTSPDWQEKRQRLVELAAQRNKIKAASTPILRERPPHLARLAHVFIRGLFLDKGDRVEPGVPDSMPPLGMDDAPDRLSLAHWLVSPDNPLTARVAANRYWARLFGVGLVESEEDFGSSGEPPSHPDLLDYLAIKFQGEFRWSTKKLLREIVLSSTYRQSSVGRTTAAKTDPANRLLARGPRHRLPAEVIRDQALSIAGLLNDTMFGPPVRPPLPPGVWQPFDSKDKWPVAKPGNPDRYRRSIYTYVKRSIPHPMQATFDQPSREFCAPRRLRSNTPLQALELLNSEPFAECAAALAERMQQHSGAVDEQLAYGFLLTLCRAPNDAELAAVRALVQRQAPDRGLQAVATALLNLDELVMK